MLAQPLSPSFTARWKRSQDLTELEPLAASLDAPVTYSGETVGWEILCWSAK